MRRPMRLGLVVFAALLAIALVAVGGQRAIWPDDVRWEEARLWCEDDYRVA